MVDMCGKFVGWGIDVVYDWSNRCVGFVYFNLALRVGANATH
jgi:hypothetical protein